MHLHLHQSQGITQPKTSDSLIPSKKKSMNLVPFSQPANNQENLMLERIMRTSDSYPRSIHISFHSESLWMLLSLAFIIISFPKSQMKEMMKKAILLSSYLSLPFPWLHPKTSQGKDYSSNYKKMSINNQSYLPLCLNRLTVGPQELLRLQD